MFIPQAVKECYLVYLLRQLIDPVDTSSSHTDDVDEDGVDAAGSKRLAKQKQRRLEAEKEKKASKSSKKAKDDDTDVDTVSGKKIKSSCIVFVSSCKMCQIVSEILLELDIQCVALHSQINQGSRVCRAAFSKQFAQQILNHEFQLAARLHSANFAPAKFEYW
jgi:hypothetical protein